MSAYEGGGDWQRRVDSAPKRRIITVPVTWDKANRKKDRSVSFGQTSNLEVSNEDFATFDTFHGKSGILMFAENEADLTEADIPKENAPEPHRSKSARMRSAWFVLWDKAHRDAYPDFEQFYNLRAEAVIESIKEELRDLEE